MPTRVDRVKLDEVDWLSIMPWLRLFRCFRSAVHPSKLLTAWLFVILIFAAAGLFSMVSDPVYNGELAQYRRVHDGELSVAKYDAWRAGIAKQVRDNELKLLRGLTQDGELPANLVNADSDFFAEARAFVHQVYLARYEKAIAAHEANADDAPDLEEIRKARRAALMRLHEVEPTPVFKAALDFKVGTLDRLCRSAVSLEWGLDEVIGQPDTVREKSGRPPLAHDEILRGLEPPLSLAQEEAPIGTPVVRAHHWDPPTVAGSLRDLLVVMPSWLWHTHPWFLVLYLASAWLLWSYFGAALSRMTAVQAARKTRIGLTDARRFVHRQWSAFLFAPVAPAFVVGVISLVMMIAGVVLFSWVLDVIGGAFFFVALAGGFALAFAIFVMIGGFQLFYPAIAFEGAGVFDAISRAASYVLNRPWRWLFYSMVATVYGAVTYLFLGFVLFLTLWVTHKVVGQWVVADTLMGIDRFEDLMPAPMPGNPTPPIDYGALDGTGTISAWLIRFWVLGLVALLFAYGVSFYSCAQSWIYVLLRRSVDGVGFNDIVDAQGEMPEAAPDKIEPEPAQ